MTRPEVTGHRMTTLPPSTDIKLPTAMVADRYMVVTRTIERWMDDPALKFPAPITINRRRYWSLAALETWEKRQAVKASA